MKITKLWILLVFIGSLRLWAVKYPVINYLTSEGLPQNQINALIQEEWGYILVGTQSGIGKFDGNQFRVITKKDGLAHNFITDFELDNSSDIWIATHGGLSKFDIKRNTISNYLTPQLITAVAVDKKSNTLWAITGNGIYYSKEDHFHPYDTVGNANIKDVAISPAGLKYFYSNWEVIEENKGKITIIRSKNKINFLTAAGDKVVCGTAKGLFLLENHQWVPYMDLPPGFGDVTDIKEDEAGNTWVGTNAGVLYFNKKENSTVAITKENGLVSNEVTRIFIDKEKNIFIGTKWGLSQISLDLFKMYDVNDGLPHEFVWCFAEDKDKNSIFIGCDSGIVELDKKNGNILALPINRLLKKTSVRAIVKVSKTDFLIGTRENGIYRWNRQGSWEKIHHTAHVLSALKTTENNRNIVWWGTENGILRYDGKTFESFREGLKDKNVWCLAFYDKDTLMVGTGKGIQKFQKKKFVPCPLEKIIGDAIINDIKVIPGTEILVATELNGLYISRKDKRDQKPIHLTTANGLLHNDVWSVIKDDSGNVWFNTSVSLDRYSNGFISHFNKKTGLFGNEGAVHAVFRDNSGTIYFSITPGFVEILPREKGAAVEPPVLFVKEIKINTNGDTKTKNLILNSKITLPHHQNTIEFFYIAVSTRKENPVFYRTRLYPFEKQWSKPSTDTQAKYMNLPPDSYTFEVEANNGGGETPWIKSVNKITLSIEKPFWFTWWFIALATLFVLGLIVLFIKIRLGALEKHKKYLEKVVEQRTEELEKLSITDPLTDLKNRRYLEEKIKEDISLIERHLYDKTKSPEKYAQTGSLVLGVFILDIDRFKKVNDIYGHKAGDTVIIEIARLLLEMLRNSDTIIRWGGEEFLIITRQTEDDNSFELSERIRKRIAEYPFKIDETTTINKTVSIGFAHFPFIPNDSKTVRWSQVISLADSALYIAKNNGRNLTVGIKRGEKPLDIDSKEILSDINMGKEKNYIELVSVKKNLKIPQPKM